MKCLTFNFCVMILQDNIIKCKSFKFVPARKNKRPVDKLLYIVVHYSASSFLNSTVDFLARDEVPASAHLVIGRDGSAAQLVPFNIMSWHAGNSHYKGLDRLNRFSIGIELINAGKLKCICGSFYTGYGRLIPKEEVFAAPEASGIPSYWHKFTNEQIDCLKKVICHLREWYPSIKEVIGHSDITRRKIDPGRAFPWDEL